LLKLLYVALPSFRLVLGGTASEAGTITPPITTQCSGTETLGLLAVTPAHQKKDFGVRPWNGVRFAGLKLRQMLTQATIDIPRRDSGKIDIPRRNSEKGPKAEPFWAGQKGSALQRFHGAEPFWAGQKGSAL
jgi:hypothetical protein